MSFYPAKGGGKPKIYRFTITGRSVATFKFSDYFSSYDEFLKKTQFLVCGFAGVSYGQYCANRNGKLDSLQCTVSHDSNTIKVVSDRGSLYPFEQFNFILETSDIDIMNFGELAD